MIMYNYSNYGMGNKVAAANIVKHFENFVISDGKITANYFGHTADEATMLDGAETIDSAQGLIDFAGSLYSHLEWGDIIVGRKIYYFSITTNTAVETPDGWAIGVRLSVYDGNDRIAEYTTTIGKVWSKKTMAWAMETLYGFMSNLDYETIMIEAENEACMECVLRYQSEFDGYMDDLKMVAENYADVTDRWTAMLASDIIGRMAQLGSDLLESLGDITGCDMVEDDGFWLDTTDLCRWHGGTDDFYVDDMQELVDTLVYMSTADSGLPLGLEQDSIDWIIAGEGNAYCGLQPLYTGETAYNFVMENV